MKVYLVWQDHKYDNFFNVVKVFSTEQKANDFINGIDEEELDIFNYYFEETQVE